MRLLTVIGLLLGLQFQVYGQINVYFQHEPVWKIKTNNAHEYPCLKKYASNYFLGTPQVFDSLEYYPMYERYEMVYDWQSPLPPYPFCNGVQMADSLFRGWLRSEGKQIFFNGGQAGGDILLYDFDLQVGDTLWNWELIPNDTLIVASIDSLQTPAGPVARFWLNGNNYTEFLLEGIGSSVGFLQSMTRPYNVASTLTCYTKAAEKWFPEDAVENCVFYLDLHEEVWDGNWLVWNDQEMIHLDVHLGNNVARWTLISANGQQLQSEQFTESTTCDIMYLPAGIYLFVVEDQKGHALRQKIVKL